MFADVRGFTSMSERMDLQQLRHSMNLMFAAASRVLVHNDALVDKFLGDAVMALFNAPIPQPRHREAGLRAAIALQEEVAGLELPFSMGIGLNTGVAMTGNVGGGEVTDYTAIGDTVNVASRLSGLAEKGEILAAVSTFEGSADLHQGYGRERVRLQVRGREQPVDAWRVYPLAASPAR